VNDTALACVRARNDAVLKTQDFTCSVSRSSSREKKCPFMSFRRRPMITIGCETCNPDNLKRRFNKPQALVSYLQQPHQMEILLPKVEAPEQFHVRRVFHDAVRLSMRAQQGALVFLSH
jgi:hypothetical protein